MSINIVYYSTTGNVKRFLEKVQTHAKNMGLTIYLISIEEAVKKDIKEKFHLFVPTRGFGQVPEYVDSALKLLSFNELVLSVSGSGNRNWGKNFCKAVDIIKEKLAVPELIRIELSGTSKDVTYYIESLKNYISVHEKLHFA